LLLSRKSEIEVAPEDESTSHEKLAEALHTWGRPPDQHPLLEAQHADARRRRDDERACLALHAQELEHVEQLEALEIAVDRSPVARARAVERRRGRLRDQRLERSLDFFVVALERGRSEQRSPGPRAVAEALERQPQVERRRGARRREALRSSECLRRLRPLASLVLDQP